MKKFTKNLLMSGAILTLGVSMVGCTNNETKKVNAFEYISNDYTFTLGKEGAVKQTEKGKSLTKTKIFIDPLCSSCSILDTEIGTTLEKMAESGATEVEYAPVTFMDKHSNDNYSVRASEFILATAEKAPKVAGKFLNKVMNKEFFPVKYTTVDGQTKGEYVPTDDNKLAELLKSVGATDEEVKSVKDFKGSLESGLKEATSQFTGTDGKESIVKKYLKDDEKVGTPFILISSKDKEPTEQFYPETVEGLRDDVVGKVKAAFDEAKGGLSAEDTEKFQKLFDAKFQ